MEQLSHCASPMRGLPRRLWLHGRRLTAETEAGKCGSPFLIDSFTRNQYVKAFAHACGRDQVFEL